MPIFSSWLFLLTLVSLLPPPVLSGLFSSYLCWLSLAAAPAAAWNLHLEDNERLTVEEAPLDEGFGGEGDEMLHADDVRALGLEVPDDRLRPLHDYLRHLHPAPPRLRPWYVEGGAEDEAAALRLKADVEAEWRDDDFHDSHELTVDGVDEDFVDVERGGVSVRPRAADASDASDASDTTEPTSSTDTAEEYARLRAEERAREEEALKEAGALSSTPPPPRGISWGAWFLRELFGWGSYADMECGRISNWHFGPRGARCYFWDVWNDLLGRTGLPFLDRLKAARESAMKLLIPVSVMFSAYVVVAFPLWCKFGLCCCCCRCYFCRPKASLRQMQKYIGLNPPGLWRPPKSDVPIVYAPSPRELAAYKKLLKKLRKIMLQ